MMNNQKEYETMPNEKLWIVKAVPSYGRDYAWFYKGKDSDSGKRWSTEARLAKEMFRAQAMRIRRYWENVDKMYTFSVSEAPS
jgi:hypothetical protein